MGLYASGQIDDRLARLDLLPLSWRARRGRWGIGRGIGKARHGDGPLHTLTDAEPSASVSDSGYHERRGSGSLGIEQRVGAELAEFRPGLFGKEDACWPGRPQRASRRT